MAQRIIVSVIGIPILVALVIEGGRWFAGAVAIAALLGSYELHRMALREGRRPVVVVGLALALAPAADVYLGEGGQLILATLVLGVLAALMWSLLRSDQAKALTDWALTIALPLYVSLPLALLMRIRGQEGGAYWLGVVLAATWASDTLAFFAGRRWGRRSLAPHISPSKTVEGTVAAVVGGGLVGLIAAFIPPGNPRLTIPLGLLLGAGAVLGDLAESFVKRQFGVKDSGRILPGHGGIMDRLDSLLFTGVVGYFYLKLLVR